MVRTAGTTRLIDRKVSAGARKITARDRRSNEASPFASRSLGQPNRRPSSASGMAAAMIAVEPEPEPRSESNQPPMVAPIAAPNSARSTSTWRFPKSKEIPARTVAPTIAKSTISTIDASGRLRNNRLVPMSQPAKAPMAVGTARRMIRLV